MWRERDQPIQQSYGRAGNFPSWRRRLQRRSDPVAQGHALCAGTCGFVLALLSFTLLAQERSAEDWSNEGARLARSGQIEQAIHAYTRALKLNPGLTPVYLNLGI